MREATRHGVDESEQTIQQRWDKIAALGDFEKVSEYPCPVVLCTNSVVLIGFFARTVWPTPGDAVASVERD